MAQQPKAEKHKQVGELKIQQKVYDLLHQSYPALQQFPKAEKFGLAQDIKRCEFQILRLVIRAKKKYTKRTTLEDLDIEVGTLKVLLRVACDLQYLKFPAYERLSGLAVEIGRMVGGWIKSDAKRADLPKQTTLQEAEEQEGVDYTCQECGADIAAKIYNYSVKHFFSQGDGKPMALCYKCQHRNKPLWRE